MKSLFDLSSHLTSVRKELFAGMTTFFTMSYILFVNPSILGIAGMPEEGVFMATCLASAAGCLIMGLWANLPVGLAPGMGLNAFFSYSIVLNLGYTWQQALGMVLISGVLFLIMNVAGLRAMMMKEIPGFIKQSITPGIGLFIALIGFNNAGIITVNSSGIPEMGALTQPQVLLSIIGLLLLTVLYVWNIRAALLLGIVATSFIGIPLGVTVIPDQLNWSFPRFSGTFFQLDLQGLITFKHDQSVWEGLITLFIVILSFSLVDLFDSIGTLIGTGTRGKLLNEQGELPQMNRALMADAWATVLGSLLGTSTVTAYVESGSGILAGGRTGLTAVVVGLLFLVSILILPLIGIIPGAATAPVLIFVGILMMEEIRQVNFSALEEGIPAFFTIVMMPFSYSIANGIATGLIFYVLIQIFQGKAAKIHPVIYVFALLFIVKLVYFSSS